VVHRIVGAWRELLVGSDCLAGCPIAAVSNECLGRPPLAAQAAAIFVAWQGQLERSLGAAGMLPRKARGAAALVLAALEGALVLCRAQREVGPLDAVGEALADFVGS
jgi:TetR/AcrR family transcriptional repressor of lmrAB and yxaGH operons